MNRSLVRRMQQENMTKVSVDLFSGPGGLCTGFKWAGILPLIAVEWTDTTVETYAGTHNADVLELSEYQLNNDYLQGFLNDNPKSVVIHGDINLVSNNMIISLLQNRFGIDCVNETVDVVSGGAPCESFSMAGTRTIDDDRDDLFANIVRISRAVNTKMILFENVKGMFSKPNSEGRRGAIFDYICDTFNDPNAVPSYHLTSRNQNEILLKAADYGVPQARERLFLVSMRSDLYAAGHRFAYPQKTHGPNRQYPYVTVEDAISDLPSVEMGEETTDYNDRQDYKSENQAFFVELMRGTIQDPHINARAPQHLIDRGLFGEKMISSHKGPGHIKRKQELLSLIPVGGSMKSAFQQLTESGEIEKYRDLFPKTIYGSRNRRLIWDETSFTVTSHCLDEILHPVKNRAITPREAARLQSFPDWYQFAGPYVQFHGDKVQDRYEQIGDAIPPLLAFAIAKEIQRAL